MKWRALVICIAVALGVAAPAAANVALDERSLSVLITTASGEGMMVGAGVVFGRAGDLTILTAAHVLKESSMPEVRSPEGTRFEVRSIEKIPGHDLALIHTAAPLAPFKVAAPGRPVAGETFFLWGHPRGKAFTLARGMVLDVDPQLAIVPERGFTVACPACDIGDSGAGVFDERGGLLGILTAAVVNADGHKIGVWAVEPITVIPSRG
jgi:S1-C subfamily serine protease